MTRNLSFASLLVASAGSAIAAERVLEVAGVQPAATAAGSGG